MKNIILIGFMGSGKTSLGKYMQSKYNMTFIDTDEYIEQKEGCKISEIFETKGEEYFRKLETNTLKELLEANITDSVIALGGGTPVKEENRELIHELGFVVYLRADINILVGRLKNDTKRPLLKGENLRDKISGLMQAREGIYESLADIVVDTDKGYRKNHCDYIRRKCDENSCN